MFLWYIYWLFDSRNTINTKIILNASHWPAIGQAGSIYTAGKSAQINPAPSARLSRFGSSPCFMYYIHSIFIMGYNMRRCFSLLNVCSSEVDNLLLRRNWSISNKTEPKILLSANNFIVRYYFLRIIVSSKFWRGVSGFYILLPGGSYLTHSISIWYQV